MNPTLDELIKYAETYVWNVYIEQDLDWYSVKYKRGIVEALQRLRELEATVKDSLTTDPRPGVPTADEVGDDDECWMWNERRASWEYYSRGTIVRGIGERFGDTCWLPYDAIPEPTRLGPAEEA